MSLVVLIAIYVGFCLHLTLKIIFWGPVCVDRFVYISKLKIIWKTSSQYVEKFGIHYL